METKQTSITDVKNNKYFKLAGYIIIGIAVVSFLAVNMATAKTEYKPLAPQAEKTWQSVRQTLCESEKALSQAKLMDIANGVKIEADLNALNAKRDTVCDFQKAL